jgi:hypothetical protein
MTERRKRGGQCIGDEPMSDAERQRRYRERKKRDQIKQAYFTIEGDLVERLDNIVEFFELSSRTEAVQGLLKNSLNDVLIQLDDFRQELEAVFGASELKDQSPELRAVIRTEKHKYWLAVTNPDNLLKLTKQSDTAPRATEEGNNND